MPLDVLIAGVLDETIDEIDPDTEDTGEWMRLRAALAARALLNVSSGLVEVEYEQEEPPTNDNGLE